MTFLMMEQKIQIYQTNDSIAIPTAESIAAIRLNPEYPRYESIQQQARLKWMAKTVMKLNKMRHNDITANEAMIDAAALDARMMQDMYMKDLTLPEIEDAFNDGMFGVYGEYFGITAMTLYGFLDGFINSEKKAEAAKIIRKTKDQLRAEKTKREYEEQQKKIMAEIEEAKRSGTFVPTGRVWYKPKTVDNAISESDEHREKVRKQAEEILRNSNR